jgi:hypothetical protein
MSTHVSLCGGALFPGAARFQRARLGVQGNCGGTRTRPVLDRWGPERYLNGLADIKADGLLRRARWKRAAPGGAQGAVSYPEP